MLPADKGGGFYLRSAASSTLPVVSHSTSVLPCSWGAKSKSIQFFLLRSKPSQGNAATARATA